MRNFLDSYAQLETVLFTDILGGGRGERKQSEVNARSDFVLFCFESIYFQSPFYNTDKRTQTITLG